MEERIKKHPVLSCAAIFALCGLARLIEYFAIRTDETVIAENFLHKLFGIVILAVLLHSLHSGWQGIGFAKHGVLSGLVKGLLLGCCCFIPAYSIECLLLCHSGQNVSLSFYVSGFALNGGSAAHHGILFLLLCIVFNGINVWMEEGVFRGLFMRILRQNQSFMSAALFIAFLFGVWHWVMPLRDYADGNASLANLLVMGIGYILLAGVMSIKWSVLYRMTGALWMGLGDHLLNNVIVTNLLHVISNGEADRLQIVRIIIGQLLSFSVVMLYYRKIWKNPRPPETARG